MGATAYALRDHFTVRLESFCPPSFHATLLIYASKDGDARIRFGNARSGKSFGLIFSFALAPCSYLFPLFRNPISKVRWFLGHSFEPLGLVSPTVDAPPDDAGSDKEKERQASEEMKKKAMVKLGGGDNGTFENERKDFGCLTCLFNVVFTSPPSLIARSVPLHQVPTISSLVTSIPRAMVFLYIGVTAIVCFALSALIYIGILKPNIIRNTKKSK